MMTDEPESDDDSLPLRELTRMAGGSCLDCGTPYSAREAVGSIALGFKNAPRCLPCTARRLGRSETELQAQLKEYVQRRECYLKAWREAERMDSEHPRPPVPSLFVGEGEKEEISSSPSPPPSLRGAWERGPGGEGLAHWNAGDMGCGELVMELRIRLNKLPPGSVFRVTATDPAAPEDIPAWCRLCGHTLTAMDHPTYTIRSKGA